MIMDDSIITLVSRSIGQKNPIINLEIHNHTKSSLLINKTTCTIMIASTLIRIHFFLPSLFIIRFHRGYDIILPAKKLILINTNSYYDMYAYMRTI
jgi:hypothetical protein